MLKSPAFSQVIVTEGTGKTIYIGRQGTVAAKGEIVGKSDIRVQTDRVMRNIQTALAACGATLVHAVKLTVYLLMGQNIIDTFQVAQPYMSDTLYLLSVTAVFVAGPDNPDCLVKIDAVAFLPSEEKSY
ncbi:RidA family protein [Runella slithyformis]|uniref:Endoribonuclease L-PSP n=1 Tax=Runella slithyformis (strain ATCC 29530 / DSM 19594 / LMG 11500 / NCIMB 11436 / LSU 4) TaxID=761193 RepID=A0A7U3ZM83_RUNSL|nr:RidA family protein [Runella slithyformis]AEI49806.1 Endoribonuclease L-PSP [Runella slithyformis DSM 19594]